MSSGVDHLVQDLAGLGIRLEAERDQLVVDAPRGVLTVELRATLVDHKAELLALLRRSDVPEKVEGWELEPEDGVPADKLTDVDRAAIDAGHHVRADGTFPEPMRPKVGLEPPSHQRIVDGHAVPGGWTVESWAARLRYLAGLGNVPERAVELRAWADLFEARLRDEYRGLAQPLGGWGPSYGTADE